MRRKERSFSRSSALVSRRTPPPSEVLRPPPRWSRQSGVTWAAATVRNQRRVCDACPVSEEGRSVVVDARPEPLAIDPGRTAVIVVDMQNDFGAESGMFARAGIPLAGIQAAVKPIGRVLRGARGVGMKVIYLTMQFEPDLSDAGAPDAPNFVKHALLGVGEVVAAPDGRESRTLVKGTWGTEILTELTPEDDDIVVPKHRYSGFFETELDAILRRHHIESLVFAGCTTSVCVDSTLRDAFYRDYRCLLLSDCTGEPIGSDLVRSNQRQVCW
jgi:ureidoacrylate peracid hydrolase